MSQQSTLILDRGAPPAAVEEQRFNTGFHLLRAIGICLVVLGHVLEPFLDWPGLRATKQIIYSFHMPLFFFITGFFGRKFFIAGKDRLVGTLRAQFTKLMVPYFTCSVLVIAAKLLPSLGRMADRPLDFTAVPAVVFLYPTENPMIVLWFVYVMFVIQIILLGVVNLFGINGRTPRGLTTLGGLAITAAAVSEFFPIKLFGLAQAGHYLVFVTAGFAVWTVYDRIAPTLRRLRLAMGMLLVLPCIVPFVKVGVPLQYIIAFAGIASFWALADFLKDVPGIVRSGLVVIGDYSYEIYLYSYFFQVALRLVLIQYMMITSIVLLPIMFVVSLLGPVLVSATVLRKVRLLRLLFTGDRNSPRMALEPAPTT